MGRYGNQVLGKKKRNDEKQMESAVDMTASSLESADLLLVQLHGMHLHLYDPSKRCHVLAFEPRYLCVCVCVSIYRKLDDLTGAACRDVHYIK